jgi:peptidoglycan/LPS O-acetylase OafA/YrhL
MPGLDGLRALAVLIVIAYHLGVGWAPGGLLGVGVFFTLSGYLITDLLLGQWVTGRIPLREFWLRRARRLLPALFVMLAVVAAWVTLADPSQVADLRGSVISAALYVNNWWLISQHISYFARFGPPSPLGHLWSLAIEEQFYLLWPWLLLGGVRLVHERTPWVRIRVRLAALTLVLAAASVATMALTYHPGFDFSRAYDGTDTRAFGLLIGAALAMVWPSRELGRAISVRTRRVLDALGVLGLVTIAALVWRTNQYSSFLYPEGLVVLSVATALVVLAVAHPATRTGRALGWRPLRWLGVRSYGIYLWHFPIIVLTTPSVAGGGVDPTAQHGVGLVRATLQVGATIVVAALSWRFVEEPVRRGALGRLVARAREARWRPSVRVRPAWAAVAAAGIAILALDGVGLAGASPPAPVSSLGAAIRVSPTEPALASAPAVSRTRRSVSPPAPAPIARRAEIPGPAITPPARTSCRSVVHIGDSTSEGLISPDYLPNPRQRIGAQYARVGVRTEHLDISGARSIVETLQGQTNAYDLARELIARGYHGCWVLALGTNDTADVYVGSSVGVSDRIARMMSAIGGQRVVWVNVKSLVQSGPYSEGDMEAWNRALLQACSRYPQMRVFDWASVVRDGWFIDDGIHYTSIGYAARGRLIADALAKAFPPPGVPHPGGCLVR